MTCRNDELPRSTVTPCRRTSSGSRGSTCFTRLLTLTDAVSTLVPMSNVTWIDTEPFDCDVELM
jgi:hypothetical protein